VSDLPLVMERLRDVKAVVFDLDGTLHEGYIATSIYRGMLRRPVTGTKFTIGMLRGLPPAILTWQDRYHRIKRFLESVNRWAGISKSFAFMRAEARIRGKPIMPSRKLLAAAQRAGKPIFLVTSGPDIGPIIYSRMYDIRDWLANPVIYENGRIKDFEMMVHPRDMPKKAAQLLAIHGLSVKDCMVVADNKYYLPLLQKARIAVASPKAGRAMKKAAHYRL